MSRNIQDVEGIGPTYANVLKEDGITTTAKFLEVCGSRKGRKELADRTSLNEGSILKWVNMCDLFRINGVAGQFAELLEGSGVDTVKELRNRNAENLAVKMGEVNNAKNLCKVSPSADVVAKWIDQAKELDPMVTY
jgi:predicted flap endonuclease-1-like 5' DNA nuclease